MAITNPRANTQTGRALKPSACEPFVRPGQVAPDRPAPDARMRCGRPESDHHAGPFETERQALDTPAVRAVYTTFEDAPGQGRMQPANLAMLRAACEGARRRTRRVRLADPGVAGRMGTAGMRGRRRTDHARQESRRGGTPVKGIETWSVRAIPRRVWPALCWGRGFA
jgi:hypothetical protein